jgi:drug/metabolite transporter (DMT)-like permease
VNRGIGFALASAALFGLSTPFAKLLLGAVSPLVLAGLLYAGSGLGLLLVLAVRRSLARNGAPVNWPRREEWRSLAAAVFFGGMAAPVALMYGLVTTAASTASLLLNLEAVFTALLAWFLFRENFDRRIAIGMLAIVAGAVFLSWDGKAVQGFSAGALLIMAACLFWALDNNLTRTASASDAVVIAGVKGVVAGAVNLALALLLEQPFPRFHVATAAAGLGFLGYGVSLVLFVLGLRHLGTARAGAYFAVAPFFGAGLAVALNGDMVTWQLTVAAALMVVGVWLHVTEHHAHQHTHAWQTHSHPHRHDAHHQHDHDFAWDGTEPHVHLHSHRPIAHSHPHVPDVHHRHEH